MKQNPYLKTCMKTKQIIHCILWLALTLISFGCRNSHDTSSIRIINDSDDEGATYSIVDSVSDSLIYSGGHNILTLDTLINGTYIFYEDIITEEGLGRLVIYDPETVLLMKAYLEWGEEHEMIEYLDIANRTIAVRLSDGRVVTLDLKGERYGNYWVTYDVRPNKTGAMNNAIHCRVYYKGKYIAEPYIQSTSFKGIPDPEKYILAPTDKVWFKTAGDDLIAQTGMYMSDTDCGYNVEIRIDSTGRTSLSYIENELLMTESINITIGTYGEHIHMYSFDYETLEFTPKGKVQAKDPSYAIEYGDNIFAVSECGNGSGVYSFGKDEDGIHRQTADLRQTGNDPCFLMLYDHRYMMTADYSGGSVSVFPISEGRLGERLAQLSFNGSGPVTERQEGSHIHQLKTIPGLEEYILATDLGADVIRLLKFKDGVLSHISDILCPPGSGPRHMEFHEGEKGLIMYCMAELSGEVLVYESSVQEGFPQFRLIQQILADEARAGGSADIHIHPSGRWLYTSHRLENDGISIFNINDDGTLVKSGYMNTGRHPRNFMITADGRFLLVACRDDMMIQVFTIGDDGGLTDTGKALHMESDRPSSVTAAL